MKDYKLFDREYDLAATQEKFIKTGRKARAYARMKGITEEGFSKFLCGNYVPKSGSPQEKVYIDALREDGLLVMRSALGDDQNKAA